MLGLSSGWLTLLRMTELSAALLARPYPGRGCIVARSASGRLSLAYFLTGRSEASRNRQLRVTGPNEVAVIDADGGPHDVLRHYVSVARRGSWTVVGNGDQVEPIADALAAGAEPVAAWSHHTYEPDPPIYTPRIWVAIDGSSREETTLFGYARRSGRPDGSANRVVWSPESFDASSGALMTTYDGSVTDVETSPAPVDVTASFTTPQQLLASVWESLVPAVRVAALAFELDRFDETLAVA
jgi:IMP cyclohydrolase